MRSRSGNPAYGGVFDSHPHNGKGSSLNTFLTTSDMLSFARAKLDMKNDLQVDVNGLKFAPLLEGDIGAKLKHQVEKQKRQVDGESPEKKLRLEAEQLNTPTQPIVPSPRSRSQSPSSRDDAALFQEILDNKLPTPDKDDPVIYLLTSPKLFLKRLVFKLGSSGYLKNRFSYKKKYEDLIDFIVVDIIRNNETKQRNLECIDV